MKLSLLSLAALVSCAFGVAIPEPAPEAVPEPQIGTAANAFPRYRLKTELIEGDATKDNLYGTHIPASPLSLHQLILTLY